MSEEINVKDAVPSISLSKVSNQEFLSNTNILKSVETTKTIDLLKILNSFVKKILEIIIPEKLKEYSSIEEFYDQNLREQIIKDINIFKNEINNLKEKYLSQYEKFSEVIKQNTLAQQKNYELLSQFLEFNNENKNLRKELENLKNKIEIIKLSPSKLEKEEVFKTGIKLRERQYNKTLNKESLDFPKLHLKNRNPQNRIIQKKKLFNSPSTAIRNTIKYDNKFGSRANSKNKRKASLSPKSRSKNKSKINNNISKEMLNFGPFRIIDLNKQVYPFKLKKITKQIKLK